LMVYLAWAQMKMGVPSSKRSEFMERIEGFINQIPPEERHSAKYFYTRGLQLKLVKDPKRAYKFFKQAISLDPQFKEAHREIAALKAKYGKKQTTLTGELTAVMTNIFKKRA